MHYLDTEKAQAVLFFGREGVEKELLYPEFETILDGFIPLTEWADTTQRAVYVEFTGEYVVTAAVFFTMDFDQKGSIDPSWNLPLVDMARTAAKGPDLGAGPIHLVCKSQCPVKYFVDWLWDPDLRSNHSHFTQIKKALKRNRLGLHFAKTEEPEPAAGGLSSADAKAIEQKLSQQFSKRYEKEFRDQMAQLLKEQRLKVSTMSSDKEQELKEIRLEHVKKIESLQIQLEEKQAENTDLQKRNQELKDTIDGQAQKIEGLRDYFEHKLRRAQSGMGTDDPSYLDSIKSQHQAELEAKLAAATKELDDLIKMKELELSYHAEHEVQLRDEIQKLRGENQALLSNSGDHLLENLSRKGVNFVTYQPGAGHITIPYADMPKFVENPSAFTAAYCGVSEKHYQAWLKHYQTPVCTALSDAGEQCCEDVSRVVNPEQFIPGESDRCEKHRT